MADNKNTTDRIQKLLDKIKDEKVKKIVEEVIDVEISYRSSSRKTFPLNRIRSIIEGHIKR